MTDRLRRNMEFLKILSKKNLKSRKRLIQGANGDLLKCISDCCLNICNGNVKLKGAQQKNICRHKTLVRTIAKKSVPLYKKREILIQKGGALPAILIPILAAAGSLLIDLLRKK
jgi:hypothetical protein